MTKLPIELEDGLVLRWATAEDTEAVAKFNAIHEDGPSMNGLIQNWTRDLMNGRHPTTSASDFLIVTNATGDIVSSSCHISQTWGYDGIEFPFGRPEIVATSPDYRRRGLVAKQFDLLHELSASRGELMQGITGIPWYYRQFGYEMGVDLGGSRRYQFPPQKKKAETGTEKDKDKEAKKRYSWRKATTEDVSLLQALYDNHCQNSMIYTVRPENEWRHELEGHHPNSIVSKDCFIVEDDNGRTVAYTRFACWNHHVFVNEVGARADISLRAVGLEMLKLYETFAKKRQEKTGEEMIGVVFSFGRHHDLYEALDPELASAVKPYAWYIRIPDMKAFLHKITPVLETRLAESVMASHEGKLKLNFYRRGALQITFTAGKITEIVDYEMAHQRDADANFPGLQFIQLVCGRREIDEIQHIHADCHANNGAKVLLKILFPKRNSQPIGLN